VRLPRRHPSLVTICYQPEFGGTNVVHTISIRNGERMLISVHRMEKPEGQLKLLILHSTATLVDE
jgi:hypothetical protein